MSTEEIRRLMRGPRVPLDQPIPRSHEERVALRTLQILVERGLLGAGVR